MSVEGIRKLFEKDNLGHLVIYNEVASDTVENAAKMIGCKEEQIAKTVIIIEIFDPKKDKLLPKLLNKYLYTKFLKDVGKCYLDKEQFNSIINNCFNGYNIKYNEFQNILGTYMIAKIECEDY